MNIATHYLYKIYSPTGTYLGLLPPKAITSDFGYNQLIGSTFAQMTVTVAQSADVAGLPNDVITDESGNPITDENGNTLVTEQSPDIVGGNNSKALMVNNNLIKVYEVSNYHPNGTIVFDGYISKTKTVYGTDDDIELTCLSQGTDMNNILVQSGDIAFISQTTDDGSTFSIGDSGKLPVAIVQSFALSTDTIIGGAAVEITTTTPNNLYINLRRQAGTVPDLNGDVIIASGSLALSAVTKTVEKVSFTSPTLCVAGNYYITVEWFDTTNASIFASASAPYGAGFVYQVTSAGTYWGSPVLQAGYSLYFVIYEHGGGVTGAYANEDVSAILTDVISNYNSLSGKILPPQSTITPVASQLYGDTNIAGAYWSCAFAQVVQPTGSNLTFDTLQLKFPIGTAATGAFSGVALYKGDPASDTVTVTSGSGSYGTSNVAVSLPSATATINPNNGLGTLVFSTPVTLTAGQEYYFVWFFAQGAFSYNFVGASASDPAPSSPFGAVYSALVLANNSSAGMSTPYGVQAMYMILGLGAGSSPNGGFSVTNQLTSYGFKMQTVVQAIEAIFALAPADWYWYVDPATGLLTFAEASTTADITLTKGKHLEVLELEATKENIKNVAYFTGGDDGTGTNKNILVKETTAQGTNRIGLALLSDNRVDSNNGSTVTARLIADNYLNNNAAETYITSVTVLASTMDLTKIKLGMMVGIRGFGNFIDALLLQVVGINRSPDEAALQLGTLPLRDSKTISQLQTQLAYQQTVDNPATPS